jgi:putative tryptophan/tyrosine transport system substrate-binding protein
MICRPCGLIVLAALAILVAPLAAAPPPPKGHRIGRLRSWSPRPAPQVEACRQPRRALGYLERDQLVVELRYAEGRAARLPARAAERVQRQGEGMVAEGSAARRAAPQATRPIPLVRAAAPEPVAEGCVASLAPPGGNSTG